MHAFKWTRCTQTHTSKRNGNDYHHTPLQHVWCENARNAFVIYEHQECRQNVMSIFHHKLSSVAIFRHTSQAYAPGMQSIHGALQWDKNRIVNADARRECVCAHE